ncbi:MAG TPA: hypothetical protein VKK61_01595, partial [Tepidisphaeraceae bacterium]|nr:hypothetical protein [Tepidisphaeraceae bacterium]
MIGLPRLALIAALLAFAGSSLSAQEQTTAPTTNPQLKDSVENYWHFGKVARYDLASAEGQKILAAGADPLTVLSTFESVAADRQDNLDQWLLRWQAVPALKDVDTKIIGVISDGYRQRRADPKFIQDQLDRVGTNERAYSLAMTRLRESGELAVPFIVDEIRDPAKRSMQPTLRRALRDLGRYALNPLVAATETKDWDTLAVVVGVLGDLGYPDAAPYVQRLIETSETPAAVITTAMDTMSKLGVSPSQGSGASDLFYDLAEKFYYNNASIAADPRYPTANIWYWDMKQGLIRKEVPPPIFKDIMAMRASEYTLKLAGPHSDDALALWLASNYSREANLPQGAADSTRPDNYPPGHYWGVEAGAKYLNMALARALHDRNAAVAFRAIRSMQGIVGQSNLFAAGRPLIQAMQFPDRKVRYEAAFAMAAALPTDSFEGSQRVVPLLAEALSQTGQPSVLVVMPTQDAANKLVDDLKKAGYAAAGATTSEAAIAAADTLPAVDAILVSEDLGLGNIDQLFNGAASNARLAGAARLVLTKTTASVFETRKVSDPFLSTTTATDAAGLKPAIEDARNKAGSLPLDPTVATEYATRAGEMLLKVGISRQQVFPLSPAKQTLLSSLADARPEIVKLAGQV